MTIVIVFVLIGLVVLASWPVLVRNRRRRPKRFNQPVVDRDPIPEDDATGPAPPGSAPYRHRQGKP